MPRISIKTQCKLLIKWVVALAAVLAVMFCVVMLLPDPPEPQSEPTVQTTLAPRPTTSNEQFIYDDNGFLSCTTRPSIPGIDVSYHQGVIDWQQVVENGVQFAFIRLGYRGYQDGQLHEDEQAKQNLKEAKAAGLKIGAYFFSQALNTEEAAAEAAFALEILGDTKLDFPLVYDWEYISDSARTAPVDSDTLMACVDTFCTAVEAAGIEPMVYFNQDLAKTKLRVKELDCPLWLAKYSDNLNYTYQVRCWQYTDKGQIPGIEGFVDIDLYFP
jgi:GH25 family lysozyme M1 (1,4-beta-N-acetylmuramidase)